MNEDWVPEHETSVIAALVDTVARRQQPSTTSVFGLVRKPINFWIAITLKKSVKKE